MEADYLAAKRWKETVNCLMRPPWQMDWSVKWIEMEQPVCFCSMLSSSSILRTSVWQCLMTVVSKRKAKPAGDSRERLSFNKAVSALFEVSAKWSFFPFYFMNLCLPPIKMDVNALPISFLCRVLWKFNVNIKFLNSGPRSSKWL